MWFIKFVGLYNAPEFREVKQKWVKDHVHEKESELVSKKSHYWIYISKYGIYIYAFTIFWFSPIE